MMGRRWRSMMRLWRSTWDAGDLLLQLFVETPQGVLGGLETNEDAHLGPEFGGVEGLGQVIVSPHAVPGQAIGHRAAARHENHLHVGQAGIAAKLAAEGQPVAVGHVDVQQHHCGGKLDQGRPGAGGAEHVTHGELILQGVGGQHGAGLVIVHHQHPGRIGAGRAGTIPYGAGLRHRQLARHRSAQIGRASCRERVYTKV